MGDLVKRANEDELQRINLDLYPAIISRAGAEARKRYAEFLTAHINNNNTRRAYGEAIRQFLDWCQSKHVTELHQISPVIVAGWIEDHKNSETEKSIPTVKLHLAAVKHFFDYLVTGQVLALNPAASVRGPKYSIAKGKTPVLDSDQVKQLVNSIETNQLIGLRDRAIISLMVCTFARVGAVTKLTVGDYLPIGKAWRVRLLEKGNKVHEVPLHHRAEERLDSYIEAMDNLMKEINVTPLSKDKKAYLFQSFRWNKLKKRNEPTGRKLSQADVFRMIQRRAKQAGLDVAVCCHTFRAAGITDFLKSGGKLERAQKIANHVSPRTTKLYDRSDDDITLDEIELIHI